MTQMAVIKPDKTPMYYTDDRVRIPATGDATFFIRADGSDSNDGLAPTSAFRTCGQCIRELQSRYDFRSAGATIDIGPGEFDALCFWAPIIGAKGILIRGAGESQTVLKTENDTGTNMPSIWFSGTSGNCSFNVGNLRCRGASWALFNASDVPRYVYIDNPVTLEATSASGVVHMVCSKSTLTVGHTITFIGSSTIALHSAQCSYMEIINDATRPGKLQFVNNPDFSTATAVVWNNSSIYVQPAVPIEGSATGRRYNVGGCSGLNVGGAGGNRIPGNQEGLLNTAAGGYYV
jgi:hypothetical protein